MINKTKNIIILSLIIILTAPADIFAEKMRIAVMNFKGTGVSQTTADNVSELIRGDMINTGLYLVIDRSQMDVILKEQGLQQSGCTDVSCAVQVGKILSAKKILTGTVMDIGGIIVITARVVDVETGTGEFSEKVSAKSEQLIVKAVTLFTERLTERISDGLPEYQARAATPREEPLVFKYDPWYMGLEYQTGQAKYENAEGATFLIAMSGSNSYGSFLHLGGRFGLMLAILSGDSESAGDVIPEDVNGYFAEFQAGINLRIPSDWFGIKLLGGIGVFKGSMTVDTYYNDSYDFLTSTEETINYTTPMCSIGLEIPMSSWGTKFACPMVQVIVLPTPDELDGDYIMMINFIAFKHVW